MTKYLDATGLTYLWGKITNLFATKADKVTVVDHGTSDTTFALTPNVFHRWGTVTSLNLTLASGTSGYLLEYMFEFVSGTTATTLTLPSSVVWENEPSIEASMRYQVSIVNNIGLIVGVATA